MACIIIYSKGDQTLKHFFSRTFFLVIFLVFLNSLSYAGTGWKTGYIDNPNRVSSSSIKIAADGTEYIAFGGGRFGSVYYSDNLMLAKRIPPGQWDIEVVDADPNAGVGSNPSLALDNSGYPKISYYDSTNSCLKYASWNGATWTIEIVDNSNGVGKVGEAPSLALDSNDNPRISYRALLWIKYASYNGSGWDIEEVYYVNTFGYQSSLALDSNDDPHISYYESYADDLRYSYYDSTATEPAWHNWLVDETGDVGQYSSLALNSTGQPRISYYDATNKDLKYASWNGSAWVSSAMITAGDVGEYSSLVLNDDYYTISYYDRTNDQLVVTSYNGIYSTYPYDEDGGHYTSITLDTAGKPAVSYFVHATGELKMANFTPDLTTTTVAVEGDPEIRNRSLAINPAGRPGVAYENGSGNSDIEYALYNGSSWDVQTVDADFDDDYVHPSLAFDSTGKPVIAYYDLTNDDLKIALWSGASWATEIVDNTGIVGGFPAVAVDSSNNPHISYYDYTNTSLKYAYWDGSSWNIETLADINGSTISSIGLTSADNPVITFYNRWSNTLRIAVKENSAWSISTVEYVGTINFPHSTSLAIDDNDNIHVSYYNFTNSELKYAYAYYNNVTWSTQVVDATGSVGTENSIALDSSGRPGISYADWTNHQYKYASFTGSSWDLQAFADSDRLASTSVAIDATDKIWIAFRVEPKDDLKFAVSKSGLTPAIFQLLLLSD